MDQPPPSRARAFFDEILSAPDRYSFLEKLVKDGIEGESEFLDYKGGDKVSPKSVAYNWSKCLSGFANADGGIIIWGIDAPKNKPRELSLVPNVDELKARLLELLRSSVEPPVQRVQIEEICRAPAPSGFVVCFIPASPWRPHRAIQADREFYIRTGDGCSPLPYSTLKALFQPQAVARFEMQVEPEMIEDEHFREFRFRIHVFNGGPATAYDPYIHIDTVDGIKTSGFGKLWKQSSTSYKGQGVVAQRPIHPGELVPFCMARIRFQGIIQKILPKLVWIRLIVFARDQPAQAFEVKFQWQPGKAYENLRGDVEVIEIG